MKKVIGWIRLLIGLFMLIVGLVGIFYYEDNTIIPLGASWIATLAGAYSVLGAFKHLKKEVSGKRR